MTFITGFEVFWIPRAPDTSIFKCESAKIKETPHIAELNIKAFQIMALVPLNERRPSEHPVWIHVHLCENREADADRFHRGKEIPLQLC